MFLPDIRESYRRLISIFPWKWKNLTYTVSYGMFFCCSFCTSLLVLITSVLFYSLSLSAPSINLCFLPPIKKKKSTVYGITIRNLCVVAWLLMKILRPFDFIFKITENLKTIKKLQSCCNSKITSKYQTAAQIVLYKILCMPSSAHCMSD